MASTEKPRSCMRRMRGAEPSTFQRAPCRYNITGPSPGCSSAASQSPCSLALWPLTCESKSIQTSSMSRASSAVLPQLRSPGWKIQARCCSSRVAQPITRPTAIKAAAAKRIQRLMAGTECLSTGKFSESLPPAHEERIEFPHCELPPGRAAVVALVGTLGFLHLAQQGVHLVQRELAIGAHGAVAGHRPQQFVA